MTDAEQIAAKRAVAERRAKDFIDKIDATYCANKYVAFIEELTDMLLAAAPAQPQAECSCGNLGLALGNQPCPVHDGAAQRGERSGGGE